MFFTAGSAIRQVCRQFAPSFVLVTSLLIGLGVSEASAKGSPPDGPTAPIKVDELPKQAMNTLVLIQQGGPFPYSKDGAVFGNRERLLPNNPRGYYREYTVQTVGASNRGARRIVCGGHQVKAPDACYYTNDHYASFRRIVK